MGDLEHVTAERWVMPGMDVLELSVRIDAAAEDVGVAQDNLEHAVRRRNLEIDHNRKPKTDQVMKRLAGLE